MTAPAAASELPVPVARPPLWLFWCGLILISSWIAAIAWITWTSSNPVTLNRRQIFESDVVLVGQVSRKNSQSVVEPVPDQPWPLPERAPISISNLSSTRAKPGEQYLFPLQRKAGSQQTDFVVTESALPNREPLIYPATPDALSQLKQILQNPPPAARRRAVPLPRQPAARD